MSIKDILIPFTAWKNVVKEPVTIKDPINDRPGAARYRGFHKNDIEKCIGCGSCEEICENEAIDMVPVEGIETKDGDSGLRPKIDYGRCCWCALCVDVCTTGSLTLSNEYTWVDTDPDNFRFIPYPPDNIIYPGGVCSIINRLSIISQVNWKFGVPTRYVSMDEPEAFSKTAEIKEK